MQQDEPATVVGRRAFLQQGTLVLAAAAIESATAGPLAARDAASKRGAVRIALVTDLHYADKEPQGSRFYREALGKLAEAAEQFHGDRPDMLVELGDLVDAADTPEVELGYVETINRDLSAICPARHYVLGNHCVYTLTKDEFLGAVERERSYYSFDTGGAHFIVLDACFRSDGTPYGRQNFEWTDTNISAEQIEWLAGDLAATRGKTVVFTHQRLDVGNAYGVKNGGQVRKLLEESGKVLAVLQGHSHQNDYHDIAGIHYCTLAAMIEGSGAENNGYTRMDIQADGSIRLTGFRRQQSYAWPA
jgi:3',5'-cyclic AMP phosphodiesterase CpdA